MSTTILDPSRSSTPPPPRLRYLRDRWAYPGVVAFAVVALMLPLSIQDRFWLTILATAGVYTIAATGLNVLSGYMGEASLGHAFFLAVGCYSGVLAGDELGLPLVGWIAFVLVVGAVVGLLVAPLSMRLSGPHLIVVTLGLVYLGIYLFSNWRALSGGPGGTPFRLPTSVGGFDFSALTLGSQSYTAQQGGAVLIWLCALFSMLWVYHLAHGRRGREMRAIRDNMLAAQVAGVSLWRTRATAFAVSGALGALAGALYAQNVSYVEPSTFNLMLSIEIVAMVIIGGSATIFGPVIGGVFVAFVPAVLDRYLGNLPFVLDATGGGFGMTIPQWSGFIFALLLVLFLIFEPRGLVALFERCTRGVRRALGRSRP